MSSLAVARAQNPLYACIPEVALLMLLLWVQLSHVPVACHCT